MLNLPPHSAYNLFNRASVIFYTGRKKLIILDSLLVLKVPSENIPTVNWCSFMSTVHASLGASTITVCAVYLVENALTDWSLFH